jgi:hypothetical protein
MSTMLRDVSSYVEADEKKERGDGHCQAKRSSMSILVSRKGVDFGRNLLQIEALLCACPFLEMNGLHCEGCGWKGLSQC